jgi:predicted membrane chloride channel (bestrophin family)
MPVLALQLFLSGASLIAAMACGYFYQCSNPFLSTLFAFASVVLCLSCILVMRERLSEACREAIEWRRKWGSEVGNSPRLARMLLVALESSLSLCPAKGASLEARTERALEVLNLRTHSSGTVN